MTQEKERTKVGSSKDYKNLDGKIRVLRPEEKPTFDNYLEPKKTVRHTITKIKNALDSAQRKATYDVEKKLYGLPKFETKEDAIHHAQRGIVDSLSFNQERKTQEISVFIGNIKGEVMSVLLPLEEKKRHKLKDGDVISIQNLKEVVAREKAMKELPNFKTRDEVFLHAKTGIVKLVHQDGILAYIGQVEGKLQVVLFPWEDETAKQKNKKEISDNIHVENKIFSAVFLDQEKVKKYEKEALVNKEKEALVNKGKEEKKETREIPKRKIVFDGRKKKPLHYDPRERIQRDGKNALSKRDIPVPIIKIKEEKKPEPLHIQDAKPHHDTHPHKHHHHNQNHNHKHKKHGDHRRQESVPMKQVEKHPQNERNLKVA